MAVEFQHHQRFWFSDGSLHLLVEKTLYRVHRYLFEMHAKKFPGISNTPQDTDLIHSSQTPYILDSVEQVDLDRLLAHLYPYDLAVEEAKTLDDWVSILTLSSKWGFESLKAKAITNIDKLASSIEKVVLGQQHDIPALLLSGYTALCQSSAPLTKEEGARLGLDAVLNIYRVRQELWGKNIKPISADKVVEKVRSCVAISPSATTQMASPQPLSASSDVPSSPIFDTKGKPPVPDKIDKPSDFGTTSFGTTSNGLFGSTTQPRQGDPESSGLVGSFTLFGNSKPVNSTWGFGTNVESKPISVPNKGKNKKKGNK